MIADPKKIEAKSFELIDRLLKSAKLPGLQKVIVQRVIHATSDLNYARDLVFHPRAIEAGLEAMRNGRNIVVDANMVRVGIDGRTLSSYGGKVKCFIDNKDVVKDSSRSNITRAMLAMRKSIRVMKGGIVAIGNAPTALFELCDLVRKGRARPALIVGVPVGFVGAKEAKRKLLKLKIPYITNKSRRGGSSVACAIVNALLKIVGRHKSAALDYRD